MVEERREHTASLLNDGTVVVAGGNNGGTWVASAEVYDPATGTWSATGAMAAARFRHTATILNDGTVLVAGGIGLLSGGYLASAELYGGPPPPPPLRL
jgi:hypothetical protein